MLINSVQLHLMHRPPGFLQPAVYQHLSKRHLPKWNNMSPLRITLQLLSDQHHMSYLPAKFLLLQPSMHHLLSLSQRHLRRHRQSQLLLLYLTVPYLLGGT